MEAETRTDEALATAAAAGDPAAFAVLYERYALRIHDFAARITRSREDGADVTQITFERAWRNLARRRPDRLFKPWLFSIAHHAALDLLRRRRPQAPVEEAEAAWAARPPEGGPEAEALAGEAARDVWAAAAALSPREYSVLHYQLREGLGPEEIGSVMGLRTGAVYTALTRARQGLEEAFRALQLARRGRRDCPALDELLGGRAPAALDRELRRALRAHMDDCERCQENSRRFVAPAELFAALVPALPKAALPGPGDYEARDPSGRPGRGKRLAAVGALIAALVAAILAFAAIDGGGPGPDRTPPLDPADVRSASHTPGRISAEPVVRVTWSSGRDRKERGEKVSGLAGYSVTWSHAATSLPPTRLALGPDALGATSPPLTPGEWWFHLRTADRAGNWTATVHLGPFPIGAPSPPPAPAATTTTTTRPLTTTTSQPTSTTTINQPPPTQPPQPPFPPPP